MFKVFLLSRQFLLSIILHNKLIKNPGSLFYSKSSLSHLLHKSFHLIQKFFTNRVDFFKTSFFHPPITAHPGFFPLFPSPDSHCDTIVFNHIRLIHRQTGQSTAQITKYTFIGKLLRQHIQHSTKILYKRIHQNGMLFINETGNPAFFHNLSCIISVSRQISCNHSKISISIFSCSHKITYPSGNFLHLCSWIGGRKYLHFFLFFQVFRISISKQMAFHKFQRLSMGKTTVGSRMYPDIRFHLYPFFYSQLSQMFQHNTTHPKQVLRTFQFLSGNFFIQRGSNPHFF